MTVNKNVFQFLETERNIMELNSYMIIQKNLKTRVYSIVLLIIVLIFYYFKSSSVTASGPGMILIL